MPKYTLTRGTHRRCEDGKVVVYVAGTDHAVFEPTDQELKAFKDRLQPCTSDGAPVSKGKPTGFYRVKAGKHQRMENGVLKVYVTNDKLKLTQEELDSFGDKFEPVFAPAEAELAETPEAIVALPTIAKVAEALEKVDDQAVLAAVLDLEQKRTPPRKGVIDAVEKRLSLITA